MIFNSIQWHIILIYLVFIYLCILSIHSFIHNYEVDYLETIWRHCSQEIWIAIVIAEFITGGEVAYLRNLVKSEQNGGLETWRASLRADNSRNERHSFHWWVYSAVGRLSLDGDHFEWLFECLRAVRTSIVDLVPERDVRKERVVGVDCAHRVRHRLNALKRVQSAKSRAVLLRLRVEMQGKESAQVDVAPLRVVVFSWVHAIEAERRKDKRS